MHACAHAGMNARSHARARRCTWMHACMHGCTQARRHAGTQGLALHDVYAKKGTRTGVCSTARFGT
eukprot:3075736-Alexandrium_andersonii.AAC.1